MVRGTTTENSEKEIDAWQTAMDLRKKRLNILTEAEIREMRDSTEEARAERWKLREEEEEKERAKEAKEQAAQEKKGKKTPKAMLKLKEEEKKKLVDKRDAKEKAIWEGEEEKNKKYDVEIVDEGILKLQKNILAGRKKTVKLCKERLKYNCKR